MFKHIWPYSMLIILVFGLGGFFAVIYHKPLQDFRQQIAMGNPEIFSTPIRAPADIVLVDPEMAPSDIRKEVMRGYWIMIDTQKNAKEYAGDRLNCRNCHFHGGNTLGGKNGSISLVGVPYVYPKNNISLAERINRCFERSLNGKPLPIKGPKMKALLAFLNWISEPVKNLKEFPWLGLPKIKTDYKPNVVNGKKLYELHCSACHKKDGQGTTLSLDEQTLDIPPLWGGESFNDGAGMSHIKSLAPFVWLNMPYMVPILNQKEAMDVAEYVTRRPRPKLED